jgi:hypothetical protein
MASKTRKNSDGGVSTRYKTGSGDSSAFKPGYSYEIFSESDAKPKLDGQKKQERVTKKATPNARVNRAHGDYASPKAAVENVPSDEANDASFKGQYNRAKSRAKGDESVKRLKEIWTPTEIGKKMK